MPAIKRSALVLFPAEKMYQLVEDVCNYPQFLSWCVDAEVIEQNDTIQHASMTIALAGIKQSFQTRNQLVPGKSVAMSLVDGPFTHLDGIWEFTHLSDEGSRISLKLEFEFAHSLLSAAFERGFSRIADRLLNDFVTRAESLYG